MDFEKRVRFMSVGQLNFIIFAMFAVLTSTACAKKNPPPQEEIFYVTGDPKAFIADSSLDNISGIPTSLFDNPNEWQMQAIGFQAHRQKKINNNDLESGNEPATGKNKKEKINTYKMFLGPAVDEMTLDSTINQYLKFRFLKRGEKLLLNQISTYDFPEKEDRNFVVHHYSVKNDKSAFSILISSYGDADPKIDSEPLLIAFYFVKKQSENFFDQMVDTAYNYLMGPGVKVAWNQDQKTDISVCHKTGSMAHYSDLVLQAIEEWQEVLQSRLDLDRHIVGTVACPPFSDLNSQTILHVQGWVQLEGPRYLTSALTITPKDIYQSQILDSDIVVLETEWNDYIASYYPTSNMSSPVAFTDDGLKEGYKKTMMHELGHFLGLDHIFDGTESIMSYKNQSARLYDYDIRAIRALYPLLETPESSADETAGPL